MVKFNLALFTFKNSRDANDCLGKVR